MHPAVTLVLIASLAGCAAAPAPDQEPAQADAGVADPPAGASASASASDAEARPWTFPPADRRGDPSSAHETLVEGGFESEEGWEMLGGAERDCSQAAEGSCSLFIPATGGAARQAFLADTAIQLELRGSKLPSDSAIPLRIRLEGFDDAGKLAGTADMRVEANFHIPWSPLGADHDAKGLHMVVATIGLDGGAPQDVWIDEVRLVPVDPQSL